MGLTKQYLRYAACGIFNVIGSSSANVVFIEFKGVKGKLCAVGACEHVFIWDLRKGEKVKLSRQVYFIQICCAVHITFKIVWNNSLVCYILTKLEFAPILTFLSLLR